MRPATPGRALLHPGANRKARAAGLRDERRRGDSWILVAVGSKYDVDGCSASGARRRATAAQRMILRAPRNSSSATPWTSPPAASPSGPAQLERLRSRYVPRPRRIPTPTAQPTTRTIGSTQRRRRRGPRRRRATARAEWPRPSPQPTPNPTPAQSGADAHGQPTPRAVPSVDSGRRPSRLLPRRPRPTMPGSERLVVDPRPRRRRSWCAALPPRGDAVSLPSPSRRRAKPTRPSPVPTPRPTPSPSPGPTSQPTSVPSPRPTPTPSPQPFH